MLSNFSKLNFSKQIVTPFAFVLMFFVAAEANATEEGQDLRNDYDFEEVLERRQIREVQVALNSFGYMVEVTGEYDYATEHALKKFQKNKNLEPTGELNQATLALLKFVNRGNSYSYSETNDLSGRVL